jgi:glycerophosphoryl diester phosphodiesterase
MRAAPGEGQVQRYVDGQFVGAIGTTGSGLAERFALGPELLILTDDDGETAPGFLASLYFVDRALTGPEIAALGGPNAAGANVPGAAPAPLTPKMSRRVGAIGHRGGAYGKAPDNTLAALRLAFQDGAAGVEVDTRLTADGVAVCFHDETLERTTNGTGALAETTLAQLKALDAGTKYDPAFAGERVPTLVEAMNEAKGKGILYLDIKTQGQAAEFQRAVAETNFPIQDLWFWTPGDPAYAAEIRALIPNAKIFWGAPEDAWRTDPNYFANLRALGVAGFSYSSTTPDLGFSAKAKSEGFIVEVFTILDPDAMRSVAAGGADFIETDFPDIVQALQPPQTAEASNPSPASASVVSTATTVLAWVPGTGATAHRIHFGTANPPPFIAQQTSDLWTTPALAADRTYYWRIDTVTSGGTVPGPVWSFTTPATTLGTRMEWPLDGSLTASLGSGVLAFADGENTEGQTSWETTDGLTVPHIGGQPSSFLRLPAFGSPADGLALTLTDLPPNGGGTYLNRYSFVFDVLLPAGWNWMPFFNTAPANNNDSDFFVRSDAAIGIGALGYSPAGTILADTWHRVVFAADLPAGVVTYYVDGVQVHQRTGGALTDGRFSLFPGTNPGPHVRLFGDEDGETSPVLCSGIAFVDSTLSAEQAADLGAASAAGIFVTTPPAAPTLTVAVVNGTVTLTWPGAPTRRLQKSPTLQTGGWSDVPGTTGQSSHAEPVQSATPLFYRLAE